MLKTTLIAMAVIVPAIATQIARENARQQPAAVVREFYDAYRALDTDRLLSLLSPAITFEDPTMRLRAEGRDQMRKMADGVRTSYRNLSIDVHSTIVSGNDVAAEVTISGTMIGPDGTTRAIRVRGASFFHVRSGLIEKWTDYFDARTFTEQTK